MKVYWFYWFGRIVYWFYWLVDEFDSEFSVQRPGFSMAGDCLVVWVCGGVMSGCEIGWESEEKNNIFIKSKKTNIEVDVGI